MSDFKAKCTKFDTPLGELSALPHRPTAIPIAVSKGAYILLRGGTGKRERIGREGNGK